MALMSAQGYKMDTHQTIKVTGEWTANGVVYGSEASLIRRGELWVVQMAGVDVQTHAPENVTISPRLGSTPRRLTFGDGAHFVTADNDRIDILIGKHSSSWIPKLEKFGWHQLAVVAVSIILLLSVFGLTLCSLINGLCGCLVPRIRSLVHFGSLCIILSFLQDHLLAELAMTTPLLVGIARRSLAAIDLPFDLF